MVLRIGTTKGKYDFVKRKGTLRFIWEKREQKNTFI